jgi:AraC-like DNA-binding protein
MHRSIMAIRGAIVLNGCDRMRAAPTLKTVAHGREELPAGHCAERHRHLEPYAIVVIRGEFDQVSYAGRVRVRAGDLLVQPTLDAHANRMAPARSASILRLSWHDVDGLGGVFALPDIDALVRAAERDPREAGALARDQAAHARRRAGATDLPDQLAADLVGGGVVSLASWAERLGVARETASRAFSVAFGVPARQFRAELRARAAWLRIVRTRDSLARIAAATGFADQAHMTRGVRALTGTSPAAWRCDPRAGWFARPAGAPRRV